MLDTLNAVMRRVIAVESQQIVFVISYVMSYKIAAMT